MLIPDYPDFVPITIDLKDELHPRLSLTHDGVSEFTFCGLYLFRYRYNYRISRSGSRDGGFIISGEQDGRSFFMTPCNAPDWETLDLLFATHDYWKNISQSVLGASQEYAEKRDVLCIEDRDNFDYLYNRSDLAELAGKRFHKKKNHVNSFINKYPCHEQKKLNADTIPAAIHVLEKWRQNSVLRDEGDFKAAREALDLSETLPLKGSVFFIDGKPVAFCSGESLARGRMFAVHFEKADDEYKGIYQFVNKTFSASIPRFFTYINREQDLGDTGLRQAKMTYRPCGFVQKWRAEKK